LWFDSSKKFSYLQRPEDLWANHSKVVYPKPHRKDSPSWKAIQKVLSFGSLNMCNNDNRLQSHCQVIQSWFYDVIYKSLASFCKLSDFNFSSMCTCQFYLSFFLLTYLQILESGEQLGLKHFRPVKPLGSGDTGRFVFPFLYWILRSLNLCDS
jgi:hypothetical protein